LKSFSESSYKSINNPIIIDNIQKSPFRKFLFLTDVNPLWFYNHSDSKFGKNIGIVVSLQVAKTPQQHIFFAQIEKFVDI
jgi:hypothetical protein